MHKARSNRRKNEAYYQKAYEKTRPLSQEEIAKRTEENAKEKQERYPVPPVYRYKDSDPQPTQPACYTVWFNPYQRYGRV